MRAARFMAWLVALLMAAAAPAQNKDDLSVLVTFGWQGKIPGHRWSPITVSISPGDRALAGTVTAEYRQGAAGMMRASVPFAATPNTTTPVQVMVWIPEMCPSVEVSLRDEAGGVRWRGLYESFGKNNSPALPFPLGVNDPLIVVVGRSTLVEALRDWPALHAASKVAGATPNDVFDEAWTKVAAAREDVETLPTSWIAYDGLSALIINPDSMRPPDPRAVEAIHTWVASGGRLIVRADEPGEAWRAWVPDELAERVSLDAPMPAELMLVVQAIERVAQRVRLVRESPDAGTSIPGTSSIPSAVERVLVRFIQPGLGWRGDVPSGDRFARATARFGFGKVTLLGFNPEKATQTLSTTGSGAVWRDALWPSIAHDAMEAGADLSYRRWGVSTIASSDATDTLFERLAQVPGVGLGVFVIIVLSIALLGIFVGPGDYLILKRLGLLQRSWATALLWACLVSVGAFVGPRLVRTESTRINRVSIEDTLVGAMASESRLAFATGMTGLYSGEGGIMKFPSVDRASWWRGAAGSWGKHGSAGGDTWLGEARISQAAAGGDYGSIRGGPLLELPTATWTFRAFADDSASTPRVSARFTRERNGWSAVVTGLPEGVLIRNSALRLKDGWATLQREVRVRRGQVGVANEVAGHTPPTPIAVEGGSWAGAFPDRNIDVDAPSAWADAPLDSHTWDDTRPLDVRPAVPCRLHGPRRRELGIVSMVESGAWGAVYLEVTGWPASPSAEGVTEGSHTRVLRIVAPLEFSEDGR